MENLKSVKTKEDALRLLNIALEHEWAVSFEYAIHAYSMPKGKYFYEDPIMKSKTDIRAQTIQIGIDEMYHSLQLGIIITQMGGVPSFKTDEVRRYPKIMDNLKRDKATEDMVTNLYQSAEFEEGAFPKIENMIWNISYDEVRHSKQFETMLEALKTEGAEESLCFQPNPENIHKEEVQLLHEITHLENELMHRYLKYVFLFGEHQDLTQRLFKNAIDHMRHWDKNSGILIKMGDVIQIENAEKDETGVEVSKNPMPSTYPGEDRLTALETLTPKEENIIAKYEKIISLVEEGEIEDQLKFHLALNREHLFTVEWLLKNTQKIKGLK
jgi:bacterioferritin (cytochrome b1)